MAVITIYDRHNDIVGTDWDSILPWQLSPGETGMFGLGLYPRTGAWFYEVSFRLPEHSVLELAVAPGVSAMIESHDDW